MTIQLTRAEIDEYSSILDDIFTEIKGEIMSKDKIDEALRNLDKVLINTRENMSMDGSESEIMMSQSFIDGMETMYKKAKENISTIRWQESKPIEEQKPPKGLDEFKMEFLKRMRQDIRTTFNPMITSGTNINATQLHETLMKLDKRFVNEIASIRNEIIDNDKHIPFNPLSSHGNVINRLQKTGQLPTV